MAAHLDAMMERCGNGDAAPDTLFRAQTYHLSFHMRIAECAGSQALRDAIEKNQVSIFNWLYDMAVEFRLPLHWHRDLIGVVAGSDRDAAAAAMRKHVHHGLEEIQARISSHFGARGARLERTPAVLKTAANAGWRVKGGRRVTRISGNP